jgi:hypothetical protein
MALIKSNSETDPIGKNSEDDKRMGKTIGQGSLYTDWKCFENVSASSLGLTTINLKLDRIRSGLIIIIIIIIIIITYFARFVRPTPMEFTKTPWSLEDVF